MNPSYLNFQVNTPRGSSREEQFWHWKTPNFVQSRPFGINYVSRKHKPSRKK